MSQQNKGSANGNPKVNLDKRLGREFWKMLHVIAVNFPDGAKDGLTQERLRGYFEFFNSLKYVLPRASWRNTWRTVTAAGDTELSWDSFKTVREHRQIARWLFAIHDAVREDLKQPRSKVSYAKLHASYLKYRKGVQPQWRNAKNGNTNNDDVDAIGLQKLKTLLHNRTRAMDEYLRKTYGEEVDAWPRARKVAMRKSHLDQAARWYWHHLSTRAAKVDPDFDKLSVAARRNRLITQFDFEFRLRHQRVANAIRELPGVVTNTLLA